MAQGVNTDVVRQALRDAIRNSGIPINEIARRLSPDGNRRSQVQKWARGGTGITIKSAAALERALEIRDGWLVTVVRAEGAKLAAARAEADFAAKLQRLRHRWSEDGETRE